MSAKSFVKTVKNARRGVKYAKKFHNKLALAVLLFLGLIGGSALFVWWQERNFTGSYFDALWTVLFTLIGQGEFATSPHTMWGRIIVFFLSIFGVALFGVVFAEVMQRLINSRIKAILGEMMGINTCKYEGHILVCGWNQRGVYLIREILSAGQQAAVIAKERPADLNSEVFFVQGNPSEREALLKGGITHAQGAIILGDPDFGEDDSHSILTALAVEDTAPDVYTVMELHDPENERYARYAHVDDILYSDSLIAGITSMCTHNEGISAFIRDILSTADDGHSFATIDAKPGDAGRTIDEFFARLKKEDVLPIGVLSPGKPDAPVSEWVSYVNPDGRMKVTLPMKAVCIVKDSWTGKD
ncbi:MAG: potassium channel protein [Synergistaceae bacterium]|nr:potassium channel protein [Synergistaceae bacterium]